MIILVVHIIMLTKEYTLYARQKYFNKNKKNKNENNNGYFLRSLYCFIVS